MPLYTDLSIGTLLQLSTAHMPSTKPDFGPARVSANKYGYIVWMVYAFEHRADQVPEWLRPIMQAALDMDCAAIEFDCDNNLSQDFQTYDW
jgi:hypothetical protein